MIIEIEMITKARLITYNFFALALDFSCFFHIEAGIVLNLSLNFEKNESFVIIANVAYHNCNWI